MRKRIFVLLGLMAIALMGMAGAGLAHNNSAPNLECTACHMGDGSAEVAMTGLPEAYEPGKTYKLKLAVTSAVKGGDVAGGFAVEATGGSLKASDGKNTQISGAFLTHTVEGSAVRHWSFEWTAPAKASGDITISVMALAVNGDYSTMGDVAAAASYTMRPGAKKK